MKTMFKKKFKPEELSTVSKDLKQTLDDIVAGQEIMNNLQEQLEKTQNVTLIEAAIEEYKNQEQLMNKLSKQSKQLSEQLKLARKDIEKNYKIYKMLEQVV